MANNFIGFWTFCNNDANNVYDYSTKKLHSESTTDLTIGAGDIYDYAGSFNGSTSKISLGGIDLLNGQSACTVVVKFYATSLAFSGYLVHKRNQMFIYIDTNGTIVFYVESFGPFSLTSLNTIDINTWHTIECTYDGTVMKIYIDGVEDAATTLAAGNIGTNSNATYLGNNDVADGFTGLIEMISIYSTAKTSADDVAYLARNVNGVSRISKGETVAVGDLLVDDLKDNAIINCEVVLFNDTTIGRYYTIPVQGAFSGNTIAVHAGNIYNTDRQQITIMDHKRFLVQKGITTPAEIFDISKTLWGFSADSNTVFNTEKFFLIGA